ncbi:MAG: methyltransferase [Actinomycetota bacterium]|nr:methyltransferase [Actinomycetota bacterium]
MDQSSLVASVDAAVGLYENDLLLAVGSVVEGLGNSKSDLDLLLIADEAAAGRPETEQGLVSERCMVDLRVIHSATAQALTGRLRNWAQLPWNLAKLAPFSYDERLLLHRLLDGFELYPADQADSQLRPDRSDLARLKLQVARHLARTIQVDMVGYRDEGDYASLVFAAQDLLGHGVDALLAGHQLTNPNPKWRARLLQRLGPDWERPLGLRPTGLPPDAAVWHLHRAPAEPDRAAAVSHALRCLTFARAVFAWAERRILGLTAPTASWAWKEIEGQPLPALEFDVDFFLSEQRIAVARLNEFGASLSLSSTEFALLLLCDGQTSVDEAAALIDGAGSDTSQPPDVPRTVEVFSRHGLCLGPSDSSPGRALLRAERPDVLAELTEELTRAGYADFLACFDPLGLSPSAWWSARERLPAALAMIVDLFLLGNAVDAAALPPALRELMPALQATGLVTQREDGLVETAGFVVLLILGNWLVCHPPQADPLFYVGEDSVALLSRLTTGSARSCLDLCAGPGLHALQLARSGSNVVAVERNPQVAELARLNARLNGVTDRLQVLAGDLYEPVAGQRFDLIAANPPTLPYPADLPAPRIGHGGPDGLSITNRVLAGLPDALTDRGRAQLVGMALTDGQAGWLGERLTAVARERGLRIRCSVLSHSRFGVTGGYFERLVAVVAAIADVDRDRVQNSYAQLLAEVGASHLSTYFLQVTLGPASLELTDVSGSGRKGLWHV